MALKIFVLAALATVVAGGGHEPAVSHAYVHLYPTKEHAVVHAAPAHHGGGSGGSGGYGGHGGHGGYHYVASSGHGGGDEGGHGGHHHVDYHAPAHYSFEYAVHDPHTGDIKEQKESRKGDHVQGYYTLKEADGTRRIVHYTADKHSGFNAVVKHEGKAVHAAPVAHHGGGGHYAVAAAPAIHSYHAAPALSHHQHHSPATSYAFVSAPVHHSVPVVAHGHHSGGAGSSGHGFYAISGGGHHGGGAAAVGGHGHHAPATSFAQVSFPSHHGSAGIGHGSYGGHGGHVELAGGHHNAHAHSISTHITHIVPQHGHHH